MKLAKINRQRRGMEFQNAYDPDPARMLKALRIVLESRPVKQEEQVEEADKQAG